MFWPQRCGLNHCNVQLPIKDSHFVIASTGSLQKDQISPTAYLSVSPSHSHTTTPLSFTLSLSTLSLSLTGGGRFCSSATGPHPLPSPFSPPPSPPPPLLSTHSHPLLSHILPSSGPERWRCTPISFWKAWGLLFLLQLSLLGPLTMVTGRGWGKGVVHHGCSMRDHRVGVGEGGGSGSSELP